MLGEIVSPLTSADDWLSERAPVLRERFQSSIYGAVPDPITPVVVDRVVIDAQAFNGLARLERVTLALGRNGAEPMLDVLVALPSHASGRVPAIVFSNFCGNAAALPSERARIGQPDWVPPRCRSRQSRAIAEAAHGAAIIHPPWEMALQRGYALVSFFPGELVPDDPRLARAAIARLPYRSESEAASSGALAAWAWGYSRVVQFVISDGRFDTCRVAIWGHSRFGKAALLAAAIDPQIAAVAANQSGALGASLASGGRGESVRHVLRSFPHWFSPHASSAFSDADAAVLDQHLLIALIAPRPVLLGGARLDRWSDPGSAFAAARMATPIYALLGGQGLIQTRPDQPDLSGDIVTYIRPGGHGVRPIDWAQTIDFLDAAMSVER